MKWMCHGVGFFSWTGVNFVLMRTMTVFCRVVDEIVIHGSIRFGVYNANIWFRCHACPPNKSEWQQFLDHHGRMSRDGTERKPQSSLRKKIWAVWIHKIHISRILCQRFLLTVTDDLQNYLYISADVHRTTAWNCMCMQVKTGNHSCFCQESRITCASSLSLQNHWMQDTTVFTCSPWATNKGSLPFRISGETRIFFFFFFFCRGLLTNWVHQQCTTKFSQGKWPKVLDCSPARHIVVLFVFAILGFKHNDSQNNSQCQGAAKSSWREHLSLW